MGEAAAEAGDRGAYPKGANLPKGSLVQAELAARLWAHAKKAAVSSEGAKVF
jgi:hypothetical protein